MPEASDEASAAAAAESLAEAEERPMMREHQILEATIKEQQVMLAALTLEVQRLRGCMTGSDPSLQVPVDNAMRVQLRSPPSPPPLPAGASGPMRSRWPISAGERDIDDSDSDSSWHDEETQTPWADARSQECRDSKVHTGWFDDYAREVDKGSAYNGGPTSDADQDFAWKFVCRLGSMNVNIGERDDDVLYTRFEKLAKRKKFFMLDWHNGGKSGAWAATSLRCMQCDAIINIQHPGLPAKGGAKAKPLLIAKVNDKIVNFMFSEEYIEKKNLRAKRVCTVERFYPSEVIACDGKQRRGSCSSSSTAQLPLSPPHAGRNNRWTKLRGAEEEESEQSV